MARCSADKLDSDLAVPFGPTSPEHAARSLCLVCIGDGMMCKAIGREGLAKHNSLVVVIGWARYLLGEMETQKGPGNWGIGDL